MNHKRKPFLLLFFLFLLTGIRLTAQLTEYSYINYDTKDGLSGSNVYSITQDLDGFIWFATDNGLSRFDGKNFRNFSVQDGLPDNEILKVFADSRNRIWILPFRHTACYYYKGKIHTAENDPVLKKLSFSDNPFHVLEDKQGNILISETRRYHFIYKDNRAETVTTFNNKPCWVNTCGLGENGDFRILLQVHGNAYFTIVDPLNKTQVREGKKYSGSYRNRIIIQPQYNVVADKGQLLRLYTPTDSLTIRGSENYGTLSFLTDNLISLHMARGAFFYDVRKDRKSDLLLEKEAINTTFLDQEGNYWFATKENGVFLLPSFHFRNMSIRENQTPLQVFSITRWNKFILLGSTENSIWKINPDSHHPAPEKINCRFISGISGRVLAIQPVNDQLFLAGGDAGITGNRGLEDYTSTEKPARLYPMGSISVKTITGYNNRYFITSSTQSYMLNPEKKQFGDVVLGRSTSAAETKEGYYIGTLNGLLFYDKKGDAINLGQQYPALSGRIMHVVTSPDSTVWVASKGNGIAVLKNGKLSGTLTVNNGLTSNNCTSLFIEPSGKKIWLGTDRGLNMISYSDTGFHVSIKYTTSDGLLSDVIHAVYADDSVVYVGSPKGLTYFRPDSVAFHSRCRLNITGIYVSDKYWAYDSSGFTLPHKNNDIRFSYASVSFKSGGDITYHYRLLGLHDDWRTSLENQLAFPTLPSGSYILELKAVNKYGVESPLKQIRFTIEKLWWEKTGYRLLLLGLLTAFIWTIIRLRIHFLKNKQQKQEELNRRIAELEQTALRAQMNPHFIFNSLNSIQQYVAERDITGANQFITDFSKLIRMTLDMSAQSSVSLSEELLYIDTYLRLERTRLENKFDYRFVIDPVINTREYELPPLLLQPFAENSIRHGIKYLPDKNGLITISVSRMDDRIRISIEDNGIGRKASQQYKSSYHVQYQSKGMSISEGRINLLKHSSGKKIEINVIDLQNLNGEGSGTRVDIDIPF